MLGRVGILAFGILTVIGSWFLTCQLWKYREIAAGIAWLETRTFEDITAITLGTGGAYENPRRLGPSTAIAFGERVVLVDVGRGISEALRGAEIPLRQPEAVYLTSLLPENTVGLDDLLFTGWMSPRETPLRLVGPIGTAALAARLMEAHQAGREQLGDALGLAPDGAQLKVQEIDDDGFVETLGELTIRAGAVGENGRPQLAYRFEAGRKSIVVSGVGPELEALERFADGAWVLIAEGFLKDAVEAAIEAGADDPERLRAEADLHRDLTDVAALAERAGILGLIYTRLRPPPLFDSQYKKPAAEHFGGTIAIAADGDEFKP